MDGYIKSLKILNEVMREYHNKFVRDEITLSGYTTVQRFWETSFDKIATESFYDMKEGKNEKSDNSSADLARPRI